MSEEIRKALNIAEPSPQKQPGTIKSSIQHRETLSSSYADYDEDDFEAEQDESEVRDESSTPVRTTALSGV